MPTNTRCETSLTEIDLHHLIHSRNGDYHPSPTAWEDQVLYFLMLDRFSDGRENSYVDNDGQPVTTGTTPPLTEADRGNAVRTESDAETWREAGTRWVGGTLRGLESKIGYLKRLGVTAIWVSPIFKQVAFQETYHGYGIQNYLDVDPHFGTRDDLRSLTAAAHDAGILVILDIILNHSGNVFSYDYTPGRYPVKDGNGNTVYDSNGQEVIDQRWDTRTYPVAGFNDETGRPTIPFSVGTEAPNDGTVWPTEFRDPAVFTQKGRIDNWDYEQEFVEGDFFDLKDVHLGSGDTEHYRPSDALKHLGEVYKFWIAFADIDGFRVDTVKHMDKGAARYFTSVIHEFAQTLGKDNFYLIGEITGGRHNAFTTLEAVGMNAALGISDIPGKIEGVVKGFADPQEYFDLFRNSMLEQKESHVWFRNRVVTVLDDHDQVRKGENKGRFCAGDDRWPKLALNALAFNVLTMGIPCVYYGSEQGFDGEGGSDRYLREAMFGGDFGAFRSKNRHCFDETYPLYTAFGKILALRRRPENLALRRGRQYLREISGDGISFGYPRVITERMRSVVAWSRILSHTEMLCAVNTDTERDLTVWVVVDRGLHRDGETLTCLYSTEDAQIGTALTVSEQSDRATLRLTVPAAGCVIYR